MNKLSYELLNNIINDKLTSDAISLLILLYKYQDEDEKVEGIYYKDICSTIGICKTNFYYLIKELTNKGYIITLKNHNYDFDVIVFNNSEEETSKGYLDLSASAFDKTFYKYKAGSKKLLLELMKRALSLKAKKSEKKYINNKYGKLYYIPKREFKIYAERFGCTVRTIKTYYKELKDLINIQSEVDIYTERKKDIITVKEKAIETSKVNVSEKGIRKYITKTKRYDYDKHIINTYCRRNSIRYTEETINDTTMLVSQYITKARQLKLDIVTMLLNTLDTLSMRELAPNIINTQIHKLLYR